MSHYTVIEVQWIDPEAIIDALADYIGIARELVQVDPAGIPIRNYAGHPTREAPDCQIVVGREHIGPSTGDLGVENQNGKWIVHLDDYGWKKGKAQILKELTQLYGYHAARRLAEKQGYRVKSVTQEGGKLKLVLGRKVRV